MVGLLVTIFGFFFNLKGVLGMIISIFKYFGEGLLLPKMLEEIIEKIRRCLEEWQRRQFFLERIITLFKILGRGLEEWEIGDLVKSYFKEKYQPIAFSGSTGGCLEAAQTEETYLLTWLNETGCRSFELPTGGVFFMKEGRNLISFAKKEQCLALGFQLRELLKILNYQVFRVFPNNEIEYLHPNDGVFSEKASFGRVSVGCNKGTIGCNMEPVKGKFTSLDNFTYTRCDTVLPESEWYEILVRMNLMS